MWILDLLILFIAAISTPTSEPVEKTWFTKVKVTYSNCYFFKIAYSSDGRVLLGIFGSWIFLMGNNAVQDELESDKAELELQKAIEFKNSKSFKNAGKSFATAAQEFSKMGNHFESGKAYEESYKAYKMIDDNELAVSHLKKGIDQYMKNKSSLSIAARHCITISKVYTQSKKWDESILILGRGVKLLSDLQDE